jgi:glycine cleavage system H protein
MENRDLHISIKILRAVLYYPLICIAGIGSVLFFAVFLPLISVIQLGRFIVNKNFREKVLKGGSISAETESRSAAYYHPSHTRAVLSEAKVAIGPDQFTTRFLGKIDHIEYPEVGKLLKKGDTVWRLQFGSRSFEQIIPVSGTVLEINQNLIKDPSLLLTLPVDELWIVKVKPVSAVEEFKDLIQESAYQKFQDNMKDRLIELFGTRLGTVLTDGGEIELGLASKISDEDYNKVIQNFFK